MLKPVDDSLGQRESEVRNKNYESGFLWFCKKREGKIDEMLQKRREKIPPVKIFYAAIPENAFEITSG